MEIVPLHDRVVVKRKPPEEVVGSIVVPEVAKQKPQEAIVLAVGTGRFTDTGQVIPLSVKVGDHVLISQHAADMSIEGEEVTMLREDEILAIVRRANQ